MKNIVISGPSASGKSTLINNLSKNNNVFNELDWNKDSELNKLYNEANMKIQSSKNEFLLKMMDDKFKKQNENPENAIFDRWIVDYFVAAVLRIKPNSLDFYNKFIEHYEERINTFKGEKPFYIIVKTSYEEFKKRILNRGRVHETNNITKDDSWYKNYHSNYVSILTKELDKRDIKYKVFDTTDNSAEKTYNQVDKFIKEHIWNK